MSGPDAEHDSAVDRRYICTSCDSVVRARWDQSGSGYPGSFNVGCECTIVPVVPQMSQAETPESWRVERPECCRGVDVSELEEYHFGVCDYACPDCGATYRWDGTMSTAPDDLSEPEPPEDQQLLTDGGQDTESAEGGPQCDVCGLFEVDYYNEPVEKGETGEIVELDLCTDCHEKAMDYSHGLDVDWSSEVRLVSGGGYDGE